jgi:hypothetical protein
MSYKGRGWNARELADAGLKNEDGEVALSELMGDEEFMEWRKRGDEINLRAKAHQWEIGQWIVQGEDMKEIAGEAVDQRFKHSIYAAAADTTGYTINTIKGFAHVVRNVPEDIRDEFPLVSFAHLKLIAIFHSDPQKQRDLLSEMLIGDLKVGQARDMIRQRFGPPKERKSKADRHAERIIAHCNHVLSELENFNPETVTPHLRAAVLRSAEKTRKTLDLSG